MEVYIAIGLIFGVLALIETFFKDENQITITIHSLLFLFATIWSILFVGLRECGFDFESYYRLFIEFSNSSWKENAKYYNIEVGYAFFNYIISDYRLLLILMAIITISLHFRFIYKHSPLPFLSIFLLLGAVFYPSFMGQYRQALAMGLVLWAYVNKSNKFKYTSIILFASLFHISSLIALIVFFIPDRLFKIRTYIILLGFAFLLNFTLKTYFLSFLSLLPTLMNEKLDFYSNSEDFILGLNLAMLLRIIIFAIFVFYKEKIISYTNGSLFINIYFVSLLIYLGFGAIPQIAERGSMYFYYIEFILVPMLLYKSNYLIRFLLLLFFMGISISRQVSFFFEWKDDFIPYKNVINSYFGL